MNINSFDSSYLWMMFFFFIYIKWKKCLWFWSMRSSFAQRTFFEIRAINSSQRSLVPLYTFGWGPIICTNCGISGDTCKIESAIDSGHKIENVESKGWLLRTVTNLLRAFNVRKRCSSDGFSLKNCNKAIDNSTATSSNT